MPKSRKKTDKVQLKLYVREELRRRLEQAAKRNVRPLNAEMIRRLEESFESPPLPTLKAIVEAGTAELTGELIIISFLDYLREHRPDDASIVATFLDEWRANKAKNSEPSLQSAIRAYSEKLVFLDAISGLSLENQS
jgi:hypothetical protein